jgi:uncharacterized protein YceK
MRRLTLLFAVGAVLAGCSSGSSQESGQAKFCAAFTQVKAGKAAATPAATGAAFIAAAADMRTYAPASIKAPTGTYADLLDNIGKAAQDGSLDQQSLPPALAKGMTDKAADIAIVAIWVSKNCPR